MNCITCGNELESITVGDVTVDVCQSGCGGMWFDNFELTKVDDLHESGGAELLERVKPGPNMHCDLDIRRKCPKCPDTIMMRHLFSPEDKVVVDECPSCAGFWLDFGELVAIRASFKTEKERNKAIQKFLSSHFDAELERMRKENNDARERVLRIARIFKFICPSYYIPGKQNWGLY